ncbi:MAG: endolytic transglycosylase MltG [bacterium]
MTNTPPVSSSSITSKKPKTKLQLIILVVVAVILMVIIVFASWVLVAVNSAKDPNNKTQVVFVVEQGSGIDKIASDLSKNGLISDKNLFILYAKLGPSRGKLKPGVYLFSPSMSLSKIADTIGKAEIANKKVVFQEGLTIAEMGQKWARAGFGTAQDFISASAPPNRFSQAFLSYRSNPNSLEGYLYPATYNVVVNTSAADQISAMLDSFGSVVIPKLPPEYQNSSKLNNLITLASIVEKEANTTEDRKLVASVFYNRLKLGMKLESDVTVNYATGKSETSASDIGVDSPYNTYKIVGLPLGPICNPGLDAILATLNPAQTDYLFFIADKNGVIRLARTLQEHEANIKKYLE